MHPVRETNFVLAGKMWITRSRGTIKTGELESVYVINKHLSYSVLFDEHQHPQLWAREGHVLPDLGISVSRFAYRSEAFQNGFDYYVDIVRVTERGKRWVVRDLYLDVLVYESKRAEVLDTDEYLEAMREGHLNAEEAAYALDAAHKFLNGLARHNYSLEMYLQAEGVTLTWHKLRSTR